jgi:hypothetical protein
VFEIKGKQGSSNTTGIGTRIGNRLNPTWIDKNKGEKDIEANDITAYFFTRIKRSSKILLQIRKRYFLNYNSTLPLQTPWRTAVHLLIVVPRNMLDVSTWNPAEGESSIQIPGCPNTRKWKFYKATK